MYKRVKGSNVNPANLCPTHASYASFMNYQVLHWEYLPNGIVLLSDMNGRFQDVYDYVGIKPALKMSAATFNLPWGSN